MVMVCALANFNQTFKLADSAKLLLSQPVELGKTKKVYSHHFPDWVAFERCLRANSRQKYNFSSVVSGGLGWLQPGRVHEHSLPKFDAAAG
jgi:hypothetical protein